MKRFLRHLSLFPRNEGIVGVSAARGVAPQTFMDGAGPLYQQIYRAFRNEILSRALAPGERVPSTRALADLLRVSRNTAVSAYEQLFAEGYLETRLGAAGTVVAPI